MAQQYFTVCVPHFHMHSSLVSVLAVNMVSTHFFDILFSFPLDLSSQFWFWVKQSHKGFISLHSHKQNRSSLFSQPANIFVFLEMVILSSGRGYIAVSICISVIILVMLNILSMYSLETSIFSFENHLSRSLPSHKHIRVHTHLLVSLL